MSDILEQLLSDGVIDDILGRLKSGKEADVYLVRHRDEIVAAKVYKNRDMRGFKNNAAYKEGRQIRNSRTRRAVEKGSRFGQREAEGAWKSAEVDALYKLHSNGVRVPTPKMFYEGVLLMQLVTDAEGEPAPRMIDAAIPVEAAATLYRDLRRAMVGMLCCDLIHGDLSPYNVLIAADGAVVIDFPQIMSAAHNNQSSTFFRRDFENIHRFLAAIDPSLHRSARDGEDIWIAYMRRELTPDFVPAPIVRRPPPREERRPFPPARSNAPPVEQRHDRRPPPPHAGGGRPAPRGPVAPEVLQRRPPQASRVDGPPHAPPSARQDDRRDGPSRGPDRPRDAGPPRAPHPERNDGRPRQDPRAAPPPRGDAGPRPPQDRGGRPPQDRGRSPNESTGQAPQDRGPRPHQDRTGHPPQNRGPHPGPGRPPQDRLGGSAPPTRSPRPPSEPSTWTEGGPTRPNPAPGNAPPAARAPHPPSRPFPPRAGPELSGGPGATPPGQTPAAGESGERRGPRRRRRGRRPS